MSKKEMKLGDSDGFFWQSAGQYCTVRVDAAGREADAPFGMGKHADEKALTQLIVRAEDANLDHYVTQKAVNGLFFMVAKEGENP